MTRDVVFTDARNGIYPTKGKLFRVEPGSGCAVPFVYTGHPSTSMLIPLRLVWDVVKEIKTSDEPSDFLTIYPYVERGALISHVGKTSHFPLLRFECEFTNAETPTHVEAIPAANASIDGEAWKNETQKLTKFPFMSGYNLSPVSSERFLQLCSPSYYYYGNYDIGHNPIMPQHVLLEGKLNEGDRWEILDVVELPFTYHSLPYPLYRLAYKRKIKFVRFTVLSIYMSMTGYPNKHYTHLYFPKMDFFTNPKSL
jgi:hypothetical protein